MKQITKIFVMSVVLVTSSMVFSSYTSNKDYGKCNYCSCKYYTPGQCGTTECKCGHSKHSHIGM